MSWEQLQDIEAERAEEVRHAKTSPPEACPNDGTPLAVDAAGRLHCKFDGYTWPER